MIENVSEITKNLLVLGMLEAQADEEREKRQHEPLFPEWRSFTWEKEENE